MMGVVKIAVAQSSRTKIPITLIALLAVSWLTGCQKAGVSVPAIFSDHMVLQKGAQVPIWGKAAPKTEVTVSLGEQTAHARTGEDGKWQAALNLSECGPGPYEMTIKGPNRLLIKDVVVGEVWVATGQSNMDFHMRTDEDVDQEISQSTNPMLRQFVIKKTPSPKLPLDDFQGRWLVADAKNLPDFSAIGYYFAKRLHKELGRPVGILSLSFGGAYCETWMSQKSLDSDPDLKAGQQKEQEDFDSYAQRHATYAERYREWAKKYAREDQPKGKPSDYASPATPAGDWKPVELPSRLAAAGLPDAGAIWFRKEITVSPESEGKSLRVDLGMVEGFTAVYWNGVKIGETTCDTARLGDKGKYTYEVPADLVKKGPAILAVREFCPRGDAGFVSDAEGDGFRVVEDTASQFLAGSWMAKPEYAMAPMGSEARQACPVEPEDPPRERNLGAALFNGMIHPLLSYAIRGVISYQGERNESYAAPYTTTFPLLIKDWREQWKQPELPYYFCQSANLGPKTSTPKDSERAELREAQTMALALPKTGQAVLIDVGEEKNNHPRNKREAGERLAKIALADTYGEDIPFSGPIYQSMQTEGDKIRLSFQHTDGGLVARPLPTSYQPRSTESTMVSLVRNSPDSELEGFAICGRDRQWVWAQARVDHDTVVVWSPQVPNPVAVRYAWADNPTCNLYNGASLPANPFRTDDFPGITKSRVR